MILSEEIINYDCHKRAVGAVSVDIYKDSNFKVFKDMSSKKKGAEFERIVEEYAIRLGNTVAPPESSEHDRKISGIESQWGIKKAEIKGSFLWGTGTHFRWQQIRPGQDYDVMVFLAIYPQKINFYYATKDVVKAAVEIQDERGYWIHNQHGGMKVNSGTFFIDGMPEDFPWMKKWIND